jgi:hypothetical protein
MEVYGFVYLWYDRKRKMYYVGCHWGTEGDGYICSSKRMRDAYRRRPEDFKRRIIEKTDNKLNLYEIEYKWLSMIDDTDLGKKYYNLMNHKWVHWSSDENRLLSVKEKVSQTKRKYWDSPESDNMKLQVSEFHKKRGTKPPSQKGKVPWNKGLTKDTDPRVAANSLALCKPKRKRTKPISEETRRLVSDNMKAIWAERNKMKHKEIK